MVDQLTWQTNFHSGQTLMADEEFTWHTNSRIGMDTTQQRRCSKYRGSKRILNVIIEMRLRAISQDHGTALENYTNTKALNILSLLAGERSECQN